jgi:adenosine deaminase
LALNSFNASFMDASTRAKYIDRLDAVFASFA